MIHDIDYVIVPEVIGKRIEDVSPLAFCLWLLTDAIKEPPTQIWEGGRCKTAAVVLFFVVSVF
jgi:hypothetical protein